MKRIEGNIVDIYNRNIFSGEISIEGDKIVSIQKNSKHYEQYILPGFIDAHVHIESSMLLPQEFSKLVIQHGTIAIVTDPHEIANVLGKEGIEFMLENGRDALIKLFFTIPSCVPATPFDHSGSIVSSKEVEQMVKSNCFIALSEVMNVPGVIYDDPEVKQKIEFCRQNHLRIDGHAPGLFGEDLAKYVKAGISTDHECVAISEALEKIECGMKILIREGSAAKNYERLKSLISTHTNEVMFCTDDSHPGDILNLGHIDKMVKKAISDGFDLFDVLKIACINPILHYGLQIGTLREGDFADFLIVDDLKNFEVSSVYLNGKESYNRDNKLVLSDNEGKTTYLNKFDCNTITFADIIKPVKEKITCIKVLDHEIITEKVVFPISQMNNFESDLERDILKIVYLNRYEKKQPPVAYIHGIGLKKGAFATSISHDSHNIIAVGTNDKDIISAINTIVLDKGGLCVVENDCILKLPLPIAGIMTDKTGAEVAKIWEQLSHQLKGMGCQLDSPFMTLSFMALIVIPELKIGENGLFEFSKFDFIAE